MVYINAQKSKHSIEQIHQSWRSSYERINVLELSSLLGNLQQ